VYLAEKALLLEVLREGDATLWEMAAALLPPNAELNGARRASDLSAGLAGAVERIDKWLN